MKRSAFLFFVFLYLSINGQNIGELSGNAEFNYQTFQEDPTINAEYRDPYSMGYVNLLYKYKSFHLGSRLELYKNPIPGLEYYQNIHPDSIKSIHKNILGHKFIQYKSKLIDITIGNFYEEFGSGLILRTYYDANLGIDNSMSGLRLKTNPTQGVYFTTIIGKQRSYWDTSNSLVRGLDADISLNDIFLNNWATYINIGASFVTKKEEDNMIVYILPENVGAFNTRLNITKGNVSANIDYAYKINDPSSDNNYIYKNGNALIITSNYSTKGLGLSVGVKRIDNMSFRSERRAILQDLNLNFISPFTKQQSYSLATIYPYTTQANGEMGTQIDVFYTIPKKTKLGGNYGTSINVNFSNVFDIKRSFINGDSVLNQAGTLGYTSNFLETGEKLFQEINLEIIKKINKKLKIISSFIFLENNDKFLKSQPLPSNKNHEYIHAKIAVLEIVYKIKPKHSTRVELQHLQTKQHYGNWMMGLVEYKLSPNWFWSIQDIFNYGNPDTPVHYYAISTGYSRKSNRLSITYGKQRAGLFCVGGVCREVPASNGFSISLTSSF